MSHVVDIDVHGWKDGVGAAAAAAAAAFAEGLSCDLCCWRRRVFGESVGMGSSHHCGLLGETVRSCSSCACSFSYLTQRAKGEAVACTERARSCVALASS